jgi:DNA mismatch repair ATPase MutS
MCGFPLQNLERHLKVLIRNHRRSVALCEEFKLGERQFERRVTRVLTPGTLIDEAFLNPYENNFVLSVGCSAHSIDADDPIGLSWMDVSTGEFFSQSTTFGTLRDDVVRIEPKEILLSENLRDLKHHPIRLALAEETSALITFVKMKVEENQWSFTAEQANSDDLTSPAPILPSYAPVEQSAISQLTTFLRDNLLEHMPTIAQPQRQGKDARMQIDAHTIKALEIKEGLREGGTTGTLLSAINRTTTTSGSRLLSRWICSPSTSVEEIVTRQNIVGFFYARPHLRTDILAVLRKIEDTARIVQKFLAGKGSADDLRDIAEAISLWEKLRERLVLERKMEVVEQGTLIEWESMDALLSRMTSLKALSEQITAAVSAREEEVENEDEEEQVDPMVSNSSQKPVIAGLYKWSIKPEYVDFLSEIMQILTRLQLLANPGGTPCQARETPKRKRNA